MKLVRRWRPKGDGSFKWWDWGYDGPPICFTNPEIRRMLRLAKARSNDFICELGCGWGQNLLVASTEFGVKKCVGIERIGSRYLRAVERVERRGLSRQVRIVKGDLEDFIRGKLGDADISDATIILYTLESSSKFLHQLSRRLQEGCRLVYSHRTLFPEIKPNAVDYPFYVSESPFHHPTSELDWLTSVVSRNDSGATPNADDLWNELFHDYNIHHQSTGGVLADIKSYQLRLKAFLRRNHI